MNNTLRYVIYCRKSTEGEDRQMLSLEGQLNTLLEIKERSSLNVVGIYKESRSAKKLDRPVFKEVIKQITSGKADAILCWKLDRLSRNFVDSGILIHHLQTSVIKEIKTHEATYHPNDSVYNILFKLGEANQYSINLSVDVRRGNKDKLAIGGWPGNAPFGYLNDKAEKTIILHPMRAPYVKRIFDLYGNHGKSYGEISAILYSEGLRTKAGNKVSKSNIQRIITSKFYMGIMTRDGKYYPGRHEPLVSKELFERCQEVADNKSRPRSQKLNFALSGFLKCESCGCVLTATRAKGKYNYYYCTNGKGICTEHKNYMSEKEACDKVAEELSNLAFDPELIEIMYQEKLERSTESNQQLETTLKTLQNELESLTRRRNRLYDMSLNEDMPQETYRAKLLELKNKEVELNHQIERVKIDNPSVTLEQIRNLFLQGVSIRNEFINAEIPKKKEVLQNVLSNFSFKGKEIVTAQYKTPFNLLANSPKNLTLIQGLASLSKSRSRSSPVRLYLTV